jgi:hypothetical protein
MANPLGLRRRLADNALPGIEQIACQARMNSQAVDIAN